METQNYARKFELGFRFEGEQPGSAMGSLLSYDMFRAGVAEFLGMMFSLFNVVTVARLVGSMDSMTTDPSASIILIAFEYGLNIFILVYILAEVSGANLNPAVSMALLVSKRITVERFIIYVILQVLGAMAGAGIGTIFLDSTDGGYNAIADGIDVRDAFAGEVMCTCLLALAVFAATDGELGRKNAFTGPLVPLVIGMTVLLSHLILIPIDGCSINPARSFGTAFTNNKWDDQWVFWIGPLLGSVLGALVWEAILRPKQLAVDSIKPMVEAATV
ncbi:unnamed protein product [Ascophyllum nodosum]